MHAPEGMAHLGHSAPRAAVRAQLGEQPQRMESDLDGVDAVASVGTALVIEPVVVLVHERVAPLVMRAVPEEAVRAPLAV